MQLKSMTGSANMVINTDIMSLNLDISSVNGRFLELYLKLPDELRHLESKLKALCHDRLTRGKIDIFISMSLNASQSLQLDKDELQALTKALNEIKELLPQSSVNAFEILNYPGVIKQPLNIKEIIDNEVISNFMKALDTLVITRENEGERLKALLFTLLDKFEKLLSPISEHLDSLVILERERILSKISKYKTEIEFDDNRVAQEIALNAQHADIREEYDRLTSHIKEVREILTKGGICGKRLDFMMQEFNRECNTLASKATNLDITKLAVELKVLTEQMREQVQNIE